jgi:hypothetical protein
MLNTKKWRAIPALDAWSKSNGHGNVEQHV